MSNTFKYIFYVTLPFVCGLAFTMENDKKLKKKANKALIIAVKKGDKTAIMKALTDGADANSVHKDLFNRPQRLLQNIIWKKDLNLLAFCLQNGANPNIKNKFGETVLHKAAQYALSFSIPLLLQQCDNVNIQDNEGKTPLHLVLAESDALLLLQAGANPTMYDTQGFTPIQLAATKAWTHLVRALINYIPMQDIIQEQRKAAILLLNCFKKLQKKYGCNCQRIYNAYYVTTLSLALQMLML